MAQIVPIEKVQRWLTSSDWHVRKMKVVLQRQGQIEPLQVSRGADGWWIFRNDPWGSEILEAARQLGWKDILIVEMKAYDVELPKEANDGV